MHCIYLAKVSYAWRHGERRWLRYVGMLHSHSRGALTVHFSFVVSFSRFFFSSFSFFVRSLVWFRKMLHVMYVCCVRCAVCAHRTRVSCIWVCFALLTFICAQTKVSHNNRKYKFYCYHSNAFYCIWRFSEHESMFHFTWKRAPDKKKTKISYFHT